MQRQHNSNPIVIVNNIRLTINIYIDILNDILHFLKIYCHITVSKYTNIDSFDSLIRCKWEYWIR